MSFLQGCAATFDRRFSEAEMNEKIAIGMAAMKEQLKNSTPVSAADYDTIHGRWTNDLIDKVTRGDCIPEGSFWTPGILEFYISLKTPTVRLMYFKQHGYVMSVYFVNCADICVLLTGITYMLSRPIACPRHPRNYTS